MRGPPVGLRELTVEEASAVGRLQRWGGFSGGKPGPLADGSGASG